MVDSSSPGARFRQALQQECPLQVVGCVNAFCARLAEEAGFRALYLSGAGVANASYAMPDLGMTSLDDVLIDVRRILGASDLPLLVDIDTGWGSILTIERSVGLLEQAGVAAVHIEDQVFAKRCGHRGGKKLVRTDEMQARIRAACYGRKNIDFVVMARTDALAEEGLDAAIDRAKAYVDAGADMIFFEAARSLDDYQAFCQAVSVPVLANMTEFGKTPLFHRDELKQAGVQLALYPLSIFRSMNYAASHCYQQLRQDGIQQDILAQMQTREALYKVLDYPRYERMIDHSINDSMQQECDYE